MAEEFVGIAFLARQTGDFMVTLMNMGSLLLAYGLLDWAMDRMMREERRLTAVANWEITKEVAFARKRRR